MDTALMNSGKSRTSDPHILFLSLHIVRPSTPICDRGDGF